ncbi:UDP-N-acetylmuramoyl-tripeptide--D-alanyl-D-alanine ligase [bacterium SCSIO 12741]|nr:UDP-N-acetylmuramoyl-tripeptide--D-alanyl-D-alanine ligase [bacterium SCSIO 12741]
MSTDLLALYKSCNRTICTDTRKISPGSLFVALKGERFNGNKFVEQALTTGAKHALIDEAEYHIEGKTTLVDDALKALQELAHAYRNTFSIPIIGITGSNGKTTSKELITAVLAKRYRVHATPGNFNNHIGLPLTLLSMPEDTEIAILEMGDNHPGEIDFLSQIGAPTHGLITNVGKDHIEGFGSFENNKLAKKELFDYLVNHDGELFVPTFETDLLPLVPNGAREVRFGSPEDRFSLQFTGSSPFVRYMDSQGTETTSQLIGDYNFKNIEMAYALGMYFEVEAQNIHEAIAEYRPSNNRSQYLEKGEHVIFLDAYNANPSSVELALESFVKQNLKEHRIVILGDMLELGEESLSEHQGIVDQIKTLDIQALLVGQEFGQTKLSEKMKAFADRHELMDYLKANPLPGSQLLIKGSRGIRLEEVLEIW